MSELTDKVAATKTYPKFPSPLETQDWQGRTYTQLDGDLRFHWQARFPDEPEVRWADLPYSVKASLRQHYRNYVGDAMAKRFVDWMESEGVVDWPKAIRRFEGKYGKHPAQDAEERLMWFERHSR